MKFTLIPLQKPFQRNLILPGSKSDSNRALIIASLCNGKSVLSNFSPSEDTEVLIKALGRFGVKIKYLSNNSLEIYGIGKNTKFLKQDNLITVNLKKAGTAVRFFTAFASLFPVKTRIEVEGRMKERPIKDLVDALKTLGVDIEYLENKGCPPLLIKGGLIEKQKTNLINISGKISSQFISALLMIAPVLPKGLQINIIDKQTSPSYIDMTFSVMNAFGIKGENRDYKVYRVGASEYKPADYKIESDASGASYLFSIAGVSKSKIEIGYLPKNSAQGDINYPKILEAMGCKVEYLKNTIKLKGTGRLKGIEVDMNSMPDTSLTLATTAIFADSPVLIKNIENLRYKESDRISAIETELKKLGVRVETGEDYIKVYPAERIKPAVIETYDDHRIAMSFAVIGAVREGITINNPEVVKKSFPNFWEVLQDLGVGIVKI